MGIKFKFDEVLESLQHLIATLSYNFLWVLHIEEISFGFELIKPICKYRVLWSFFKGWLYVSCSFDLTLTEILTSPPSPNQGEPLEFQNRGGGRFAH